MRAGCIWRSQPTAPHPRGSRCLRLPDATRAYLGREITAGLRPEAISDKLEGGGAEARPLIEAMVEVTEPTGPDTLAVLLLGGREITARLQPDSVLKPGERGRFAIDLAKLVWFDPASGARVA